MALGGFDAKTSATVHVSYSFFPPFFRNCPSDDTRNKSRHGRVLGNVALERHGDHGKVGFLLLKCYSYCLVGFGSFLGKC